MHEFEREFHELLGELHRNGSMRHLVLIGSWCLLIYRDHYPIKRITFTTSDVDFSIERPRDLQNRFSSSLTDSLLKLGYVPKAGILSNAEKYIPAPDAKGKSLSIEFLCEPGRHIKGPYRIPKVGIIAMPLSHQKVLLENVVELNYQSIPVRVPAPAIWAIHKIAISQLRSGKGSNLKMIKDLENASIVVQWLGRERLQKEAAGFRGKFRALFEKGFRLFQERFIL